MAMVCRFTWSRLSIFAGVFSLCALSFCPQELFLTHLLYAEEDAIGEVVVDIANENTTADENTVEDKNVTEDVVIAEEKTPLLTFSIHSKNEVAFSYSSCHNDTRSQWIRENILPKRTKRNLSYVKCYA